MRTIVRQRDEAEAELDRLKFERRELYKLLDSVGEGLAALASHNTVGDTI
jgi:hypothetical protein